MFPANIKAKGGQKHPEWLTAAVALLEMLNSFPLQNRSTSITGDK
jgi:hypothetical protein